MSSLVFISYSRADKIRAKEIRKWIREEVGFPTFLDTSNIKMAHAWKALITNSLDSCFAVVILLSPKSAVSNYVTYEWSYAMGKGKKIIPLVIDANLDKQKLNEFLKDTQYSMDFINPQLEDWEALKSRLIELKELSDIPEEVLAASKLARDPLPANRAAGIETLENYIHEASLRELRMFARDDALGDRQINAALALTRRTGYQDEDAIAGLERTVSERIYQKKDTARHYLVRIGTYKAAQALFRAYSKVLEHERKEVISALLEFSDHEITKPVFLDLIEYPQVPMKLDIWERLSKQNEELIIPDLYEFTKTTQSFEAAERAITILGIYKEIAGIEALCNLLAFFTQKRPTNHEFFEEKLSKLIVSSASRWAVGTLEHFLEKPSSPYQKFKLEQTLATLKSRIKL